MKIQTRYHGEMEINSEEIVTFPKGIPGFPEEKEFVILPLGEDQSFSALQSLANDALAFIISNPFNFYKEYDFHLEESVVEELGLNSEKDIVVYAILTVEDPFEKTTANMQAPIVINTVNKKAKQVILNDMKFKTKQPVFQGK
jgi:flagellar assembly factor FliW